MSQLEDDIKPLLTSLVYGQTYLTLSALDQRLLADWITKTTMTAEFLVPDQIAISQRERNEYRLRRLPNDNWQIWAAYYTGTKFQGGGIFHDAISIYHTKESFREDVKNTQYTVFGLGRFVAISLSSEQSLWQFNFVLHMDQALQRLWPSRWPSVAWPLSHGIDDAALEWIIKGFTTAIGRPRPGFGT